MQTTIRDMSRHVQTFFYFMWTRRLQRATVMLVMPKYRKAPNIARALRDLANAHEGEEGWDSPQARIAEALGFGEEIGQVNKWWNGSRPVGDILNLDRLKRAFPAFEESFQKAYEADRALAKARLTGRTALTQTDREMLSAVQEACDSRNPEETSLLLDILRGLRDRPLSYFEVLRRAAADAAERDRKHRGKSNDAGLGQ